MPELFKTSLHQLVAFTDEQYLLFKSRFKSINVLKNEYWLTAGQPCSHLAFIESGLLRQYYLTDDGNEVTCHFGMPGEFITSYHSYTQAIISVENIQALADCELLVIHRTDFNHLLTSLPQAKILWDVAVQILILQMEDRIAMLQSLSAEKRYLYLFKHHPEFLLHVPLQYIASYMGITPQHLSRLRKMIS